MNIPSSFRFSLAALATAGAALAPAISHAQAQPSAMGASEWQTSLSIYAYLPTIGGSTTFPDLARQPSPGINVDANTIIDHLKMTFMGTLDIHNGKWGAFTDILYVDIGGNKSKTRDFHDRRRAGRLTGDLSLDIKGTIWTTWRSSTVMATSDPAFTVDAAGRRAHVQHEEHPGLEFHRFGGIAPPGGSQRLDRRRRDLWDAIVGVKGNLHLRRRAPMVRPLLLRHRHRPVGPDLPDPRRYRLPVQVG
jgi:hypothetical protein